MTEKRFREEVHEAMESLKNEFGAPNPFDLADQIKHFKILPGVLVDAEWEEGAVEVHKHIRTTEWTTISPITSHEVVVYEIENPSGSKAWVYDSQKRACKSFEKAASIALRRDMDDAMRRPNPTLDQLAMELAQGVTLTAATVGRDLEAVLKMAKGLAAVTGRQDSRFWNFFAERPLAADLPARERGEVPCHLVGFDAGNGWRKVRLDLFPGKIACYCSQVHGEKVQCKNAPPIPIGDPKYRYLGNVRYEETPCNDALAEHQRLLNRAAMEETADGRHEYEVMAEEAITGDIRCVCKSERCRNLDEWRVR